MVLGIKARVCTCLAFTLPAEASVSLYFHWTGEECHHVSHRHGFANLLCIHGPVLSTGVEIEATLGLSLKQFLVTVCHPKCAIIDYHRLDNL